MDPIVAALIIWLSSHGGKQISVPPPIEIVQQQTIDKLADARHVHPRALCINGKLYLSNELNPNKDYDRSIIVHELVHWAQTHGQISGSLIRRAENEREAYAIQNRYLRSIHSGTQVVGSHGESEIDDEPTTGPRYSGPSYSSK